MAETTPFRPFENLIDQETALAHLRDAVAGADDGELFLERRRSEVMSFDDGRLKTASYDASEGFGLRAVRGETAVALPLLMPVEAEAHRGAGPTRGHAAAQVAVEVDEKVGLTTPQ